MKKCSTLKHLDFYGKTLGFHYRGEDKMRSFTGSVISLVVFVAICALSFHRLTLYFAESHRTFYRHSYEGYFLDGHSSANAGEDQE